jgi:hypothetical protein
LLGGTVARIAADGEGLMLIIDDKIRLDLFLLRGLIHEAQSKTG